MTDTEQLLTAVERVLDERDECKQPIDPKLARALDNLARVYERAVNP